MSLLSVEANGVNFTYAEGGKGQSVVLVHGGLNDNRLWGSTFDRLAEKYHVIAYNRRYAYPNRYRGDHSDDTIKDNSADLVELIKKLKVSPAHVIGHSYGGFIAAYCALQHPELVKSLVLHEPAMVIPVLIRDPKSRLQILSLLLRSPSTANALGKLANKAFKPAEEAFRHGDTDRAMRVFLDGINGRENALEQLPPAARTMIVDNAESLKGELTSGVVHTRFNKDDAHNVIVPTLLIKGDLSPKPLQRTVDILAKWLPNNEVVTIHGASHGLPSEKPEEFCTAILDFLARHN